MATDTSRSLMQRLLDVQKKAHAPRAVDGRFGKARSAEQILEAYKPICQEEGLYLYTTDELIQVGERNYVETTAIVVNADKPEEKITATASAWENNVSGGLDTSQVSGKTSSYAKKYALQNLFAIDDTKDADFDQPTKAVEPKLSALDRLKQEIAKEMNRQGMEASVKKKSFIVSVLKKSTIDTEAEAEDVREALRINDEANHGDFS